MLSSATSIPPEWGPLRSVLGGRLVARRKGCLAPYWGPLGCPGQLAAVLPPDPVVPLECRGRGCSSFSADSLQATSRASPPRCCALQRSPAHMFPMNTLLVHKETRNTRVLKYPGLMPLLPSDPAIDMVGPTRSKAERQITLFRLGSESA